MVKLVLLVSAILFFGVDFLPKIVNQLTSASNIIMDLYNSNKTLLEWASSMSILFSHPFMLCVMSILVVKFIISKTLYS